MHAILSLRPNVTREEAIACFQPPGLFGWLRRARTGPLRRIADAYVPFRLYRVGIRNGARSQLQLLALDAVSGSLDLYAFDRVPEAGQLVPIETRNVPLALLEEARSRELLAERVRRILYRTGFFRLRNPQISAELVPVEFHVPYWIGILGSEERVQLAVLDAVRRRIEGGKARALFENWLAA